MKYKIVRFYQRSDMGQEIVKRGLTLDEAREHCNTPETSSSTCSSVEGVHRTTKCGAWFDGYEEDTP